VYTSAGKALLLFFKCLLAPLHTLLAATPMCPLFCTWSPHIQIVPADLNAFLYQLEVNIAWAASELGDTATQQRFEAAARDRHNSMTRLLWDNEAGGAYACWLCCCL
jgi:hypothetical protein